MILDVFINPFVPQSSPIQNGNNKHILIIYSMLSTPTNLLTMPKYHLTHGSFLDTSPAHISIKENTRCCCGRLYIFKITITISLFPHALPVSSHSLIKRWNLFPLPVTLNKSLWQLPQTECTKAV